MAEPEVTGGNGWSMENIENSPEEQDNSNRPDSDISVEEILTEDTEEEKEEVKDVEEVVFHLGDILWCRQLNTCYHPAVIVNDPHYKFCTKIVKSESGSGNDGGETRQYHIQFLSDNRLQWIAGANCMLYRGLEEYDKLVIEDVNNIRIYKPKADRMQAWKDSLVTADEIHGLDTTERVRRLETMRMFKRDRAFMNNADGKKASLEAQLSPVKVKPAAVSPKKAGDLENDDKSSKKSSQYRRKDEMEYKMHRIAGRSTEGKKSKSNPEKDSSKPSPAALPVFNTNASFTKSFKIKKAKKPEPEVLSDDVKSPKEPSHTSKAAVESQPPSPAPVVPEVEPEDVVLDTGEPVSDYVLSAQKVERSAEAEGFGEGSLVWSKMRGYPYWPSIVTRDPNDGKFVKVADTIYKHSRRLHVLFLEYGNQRAWIGSSSVKTYKTLEIFLQDKEKATKKTRPDYTPNKRLKAPFDKAIKYAEELRVLSNPARLEKVLLKYGWALVADDSSGEEPQKLKHQDRESAPMDSETDKGSPDDTHASSGSSKVSPDSRRSSAEAQSRIDPGTDEMDVDKTNTKTQEVKTRPRKRESSLFAAIAMNGDSSDSDSQSSAPPARKKSKPTPQPKEPRKSSSRRSSVATPSIDPIVSPAKPINLPKLSKTPKTPAGTVDKDEFPRVGDLVWGRMPGFPYWPAFVTRSPQDIYRKEMANGKATYHVQFFNWNDESGWVTTVLEFEGIEAFKAIAAKRKSDKSMNPAKGPITRKLEKAAKEAEDTLGLTRQERVDQYFVSYAHKLPGGTATTPAATKPQPSPRPAPRPAPSISSVVVKSPKKKVAPLPTGWISEKRMKEGKEATVYISPDGIEFPSKAAMQREIAGEKQSTGVKYIDDPTLPTGWRCQQIQSSVFFFSPIGERFDSRRKVADRMRSDGLPEEAISKVLTADKSRRPAPKSVLKARGEYVTDESSVESDDDDSEDLVKILPKGYKYRFGGPHDDLLDIEKIFDPSDGGIIDMVQLPDIFLAHPTVRVQEADNEMIISDVHTDEFIAKKIIYD